MDLQSYRQKFGRFPIEWRDLFVHAEEFARIAASGPEPIGAAALIWDDARRILLVRDAPTAWRTGRWATPGGMAEPGDSPETCVVRETEEETGLDVRITGITKVIRCQMADESRLVPFTFFQFEGHAVGGTLRPGKGILEVAWFDRLPDDMHWRADYLERWMRGRPSL